MGGVVPPGESNDHLVDNLVEGNFIKSKEVENAFRKVDRGDFYPGLIKDAYIDFAFKGGNLHMSAATIYCEVVENLEIKSGLSFLNIGSGTGYLSTVVGVMLGPKGINHGVDIHKDIIEYAVNRVNLFMQYGRGFNSINFCEPEFVLGNGLFLDSNRKYDRVYCGARIHSEASLQKIKSFLKEKGVLIYPFQEHLVKSQLSNGEWQHSLILQAQFTNLEEKSLNQAVFQIYTQPSTLQALCRIVILQSIKEVKLVESLPLPRVLIRYLKFDREF
ncbi:protein-L-isoaspartate O-methyltransferase domain-containing protein 2 isoform X2 [Hydra vulgaris]|uniref:Protein-L-isoaspartate O-methyltransferase domain-containing protein 2 isoform X2 n=1 Tax=Hydra vulgaris TaxID=6087 RepID=A0ABM4D6G0_HYDVU